MTWTGTTLSINIKDTDGNIVSAVVTRPTKPYEAVPLSTYVTSPIEVKGYIVMNENIDTVTYPVGYELYESCANLLFKPFTTQAMAGEYKADIAAMKMQIQKEEAPLCVSRFDRGALNPNGLYNNSYISVARRFSKTHDSVFVFGNKDAAGCTNKFWDVRGVYVHERSSDGLVYNPSNVTQFGDAVVAATATDNILPIIVGAVNNPDGDNTEKWFTGQNHAYGNTGSGPTPTMREVSCSVNVDGIDVPIGASAIRGRVCTMEVVNMVQGYNTCKQAGGGREIIKQKITVKVTNDICTVRVEYMALEAVVIYSMLGVAQYAATNTNTQYRLVGSTSKPGLYTLNGTGVVPDALDNKINAMEFIRNGVAAGVVFKNIGIGNMAYNTTQGNAYATTANKVYTRLTDDTAEIHLAANDMLCFEFDYTIRDNEF